MFMGRTLKMVDSAITKKQSNTGNIYIEETGNLDLAIGFWLLALRRGSSTNY